MGKSTSWKTGLALLVFNNTTYANVGDATGLVGSTTAGSLYVALHTADPGAGGTQATSEAGYVPYARIAVARTSGGWTCTAGTAANTAAVTFAACSSSSSTVTYVSIGVAGSSTTAILYSGILTAQLAVTAGITPQFAIGTLSVAET